MEHINVFVLFLFLYALTWAALVIGVVLVANNFKPALLMRTWFIEKRKIMFRYPPFSILLDQWLKNNYMPAALIFLFIIIVPAIVLQFLMGMILISPLLAVYQGMTVGILIGNLNTRSTVWAAFTGLFELGYFAFAGALGMYASISWLFEGINFSDALSGSINIFSTGYWIFLAVCAAGNAFLETAGPIYWNMQGPITLSELKGSGDRREILVRRRG